MAELNTADIEKWKKKGKVDKLIKALDDPAWNIRNLAAAALWEMGDQRAVEPLIARLDDEDDSVRLYVILALGGIGDQRAVEPLIATIRRRKDFHDPIMQALEKIGGPRTEEFLASVKALEDKATDVSVVISITGRIHGSSEFVGEYDATLPLDTQGPELLNSIARSIIQKGESRYYTGYQLLCPGSGTIKAVEGGKPATLREAGVKEGDRLGFLDWGGSFL